MALDAGSLTRSLTLAEQGQIQAVVLSHRHFDHVRDLLTLGLNIGGTGRTVEVWALRDTLDCVAQHLLDGVLYPNFTQSPSPEAPTYRLCDLEPCTPIRVLDYTVVALPVPHGTPAVALQVTGPDNRRLFFSGDTGPGLRSCWEYVAPHLMVIEVTFPNEMGERAQEVGHLTPEQLREELEVYRQKRGSLPPVLAVHRNPSHEERLLQELAATATSLGASITPAQADMVITV